MNKSSCLKNKTMGERSELSPTQWAKCSCLKNETMGERSELSPIQWTGCSCPFELSRGSLNWNGFNRLGDDPCHIKKRERESIAPGCWNLTSHDPTVEQSCDYQQRLSTLMTHQKPYCNSAYIECDTKLTHVPLTNLRTIHQLYTRPYVGNYQGPGRHSLCPNVMDVESRLQQGNFDPQIGSCGRTGGKDITSYGMNYLPCFGNPQKVERVVQPAPEHGGWIRGGENTRDLVRQIDYRRNCLNKQNSMLLRERARLSLK